jgi:hypothetical protein
MTEMTTELDGIINLDLPDSNHELRKQSEALGSRIQAKRTQFEKLGDEILKLGEAAEEMKKLREEAEDIRERSKIQPVVESDSESELSGSEDVMPWEATVELKSESELSDQEDVELWEAAAESESEFSGPEDLEPCEDQSGLQ